MRCAAMGSSLSLTRRGSGSKWLVFWIAVIGSGSLVNIPCVSRQNPSMDGYSKFDCRRRSSHSLFKRLYATTISPTKWLPFSVTCEAFFGLLFFVLGFVVCLLLTPLISYFTASYTAYHVRHLNISLILYRTAHRCHLVLAARSFFSYLFPKRYG